MPPPPDRSHILTEQRHPRSASLHAASIDDTVNLFIDDHCTVHDALRHAAPDIAAFIRDTLPGFLAGGRLIYLGAGTSGRLGVLDASECPPTFCTSHDRVIGIIAGGDPALRRSSEGLEDNPAGAIPELTALSLTSRDALLGIAAGGTTPFVRGALDWAASLPSRPTLALLTCSPVPASDSLTRVIFLSTGPEVITGSTRLKAGSATKAALNIISTTLMIQSGKVYQNLMVDVRATNDKLRDRAARIISTLTALPRDRALALLDQAGGSAKIAVVMHARAVDCPEAQRLLDSAQGRLDRVLDSSVSRTAL